MLEKIITKRSILFLALFICCSHAFLSVYKFFYYYNQYIFEIVEQFALDLLMIIIIAYLCLCKKRGENWKDYVKSYFCMEQLFLSFVFVAFVISCLVLAFTDGMDGAIRNQDYGYDLFVCIFIAFPIGRYYFGHPIPNAMRAFVAIGIHVLTICMVWILINVFRSKTIYTVLGGRIGMFQSNNSLQLWINCHPNTVGMYAALILLVIIFLAIMSKGVQRYVYLAECVIHFIVLSLSNSRGSFFSFLSTIVLVVGGVIYYNVNPQSKIKKWCIIFVGVLITVFVFYFMKDLVFFFYDKVRNSAAFETTDYKELVREIKVLDNHGRSAIWATSVRFIFSSFRNALIGVTPLRVEELIGEMLQWGHNIYTHNQLLEVAAGIGLPALICFVVFLFVIAKKCLFEGIKVVTGNQWKRKLILTIVFFLVTANVMEATLLFYGYLTGIAFMILCGWVCEIKDLHSSSGSSKISRM